MIDSLADLESRPSVIDGLTGVWVGGRPPQRRKIGSIGVHVNRGVTTHGFAVNVNNDLQPFEWIVPCGIDGCRMTSLSPRARRGAGHGGFMDLVGELFGADLRARADRGGRRLWPSWPARGRLRYQVADGDGSAGATADARGRGSTSPARAPTRAGGAGRGGKVAFRARKPPWLKVPAPGGPTYRRLKKAIETDNLHTVCQEANCPNVGECWERGTATFMILGDVCTRRCGFCNVQTGKPTWNDPLEPLRVANQVKRMGLRHAVITSVDRDDLPDYGAGAFVGVIRSIRRMAPGCKVEVLTPDFRGQEMPLAKVIAERPDVFNHNVETVPRLYPIARRGSDFMRSARVLRMAKEMAGDEVVTKSGLMVGLGEEFDEMVEAFGILREHRVQVLTVGQYLRRPRSTCRSTATGIRTSSPRWRRPPTSSASSRSPPARWCAAPTTPTSSSRRRRPPKRPRPHLSLQGCVSGFVASHHAFPPTQKPDRLLSAAFVLALAAGPLSGGAVSQTTDDPAAAKNPLAGDGMWIWYLSRSSHGNACTIAAKAHSRGIETVLIKSGDGTHYWGQFTSSVVSQLQSRGLNVCAWQFIYGRKPGKEARVGAAAVARGADCLVMDVEGQYEGRYPRRRPT